VRRLDLVGTWQGNEKHIAWILVERVCSYRIKKMHSFGLGEIDQDALMLKIFTWHLQRRSVRMLLGVGEDICGSGI
jgi:hypothetical protein